MALDKKISPNIYSLNKCNPKLSGNIKFVCDGDDIYIDSIDSSTELSRSLYKAYKVNNDNNLMANVKNYSDLFTNKIDIFDVKKDLNNVVTDFSLQHERIYNYGAYSDKSELITKRFRFFAPIYLDRFSKKPDVFVIYSIDRENLKNNKPFIKKLLHVHDFRTSMMGKQLDRHIKYMKDFEDDMGLFVNFDDNISYTGTSLNSGLIETKYSSNLDNQLSNERTLTEFNDSITNGFGNSEIIDSRYLNLDFSFDLDLNNIELNDSFVDVVGFYANMDELESINEFNESDAFFKVMEHSNTLNSHIDIIDSNDLVDSSEIVSTINAIQFTSENHIGDFAPLIMLEPKFIPNIGDRIELTFDGNIEVNYFITESDIVNDDIIKTAENISKSFSNYVKNVVSNIFIDSFIHDGKYLVIRSLLNGDEFNNIKLTSKPSNYNIIGLKGNDYDNNFYSPSNKSVLSAFPLGLEQNGGDTLEYKNSTGKVIEYGKWLSYYFYNLDNEIREDSPNADLVNILRTSKSKLFRLKTMEHRAFDFDREYSYHSDVFDFHLDTYKNWCLNEINKDSFLGKYTIQPPQNEMDEYKNELRDIVKRYFDSISLDREMLIKDINTDNFEASSIKNEFDRLSENDNIELLKSNMINQHINKFMYKDGLDVYNRPYTLNVSLPFRYSNFAPSLGEKLRDLRNSTHSWCVIGTGVPPYFKDFKINGKNALVYKDIETEQPTNIIERFYNNNGTVDEMSKWVLNNGNIISSGNDKNISFTPLNSENSLRRKVDIRSQVVNSDLKLSYDLNLINSANTNINLSICLVDDNSILNEWDVNVNVIGGIITNIKDTKNISLPDTIGEDLYIEFKMNVGHTSTLELVDINFHKTTLNSLVIDDEIIINDDVYGMERHFDDILSSYTIENIDSNSLKSITFDAYNHIKSHTIIREEDGIYTTFFRGVKLEFPSKYENWKFSVILNTKTAPSSEDRSIELIENNIFKSITLYVNMYIPEPVLTGLEQSGEYWLDRSLLYFSDGNYATESSLSSFGKENISLKIHERNSPKVYLGDVVTNDWYFQRGGENYIHVGKGILERFNVDFTSFLDLKQDFIVSFGDTDPLSTTNYGMEITFKNIQEVSNDYFWCSEIHVKIKENNGGVITVVEYDMLSEFLADSEVFYKKNRMDIVEDILKENAEYDRVLRNVSAINRFSLLSTSDIIDWVKSNDIKVTNENDEVYYSNISSIEPIVKSGVISLKSDNRDIKKLNSKYTNTFIRQNGLYTPITKVLRKSSYKYYIDYLDYGYSMKASNDRIIHDVLTNDDRLNENVWFYRNDFSNIDLDKHYKLYENKKDFKILPWISNPMEYKHDVSIILSSVKEIEINLTKGISNIIHLYEHVKPYLLRILSNYGFNENNFSDELKIDIIKLNNPNVNKNTLSNYDFTDIITRRLFESDFNDIYTVSKIFNGSEQVDFLDLDSSRIELIDNVSENVELKVLIDRV